ncbi:MAG: hypothetical protein ACPGO5_01580 [Patescibacteria group bacterium]
MNNLHNNKGISLFEVLITVGIFVVVVVVWNQMIIQSYRSAAFGQEQQEAIRQAERGIEQMTKEIREMSTAEDGSYALELAGDNEIIFYSDIDQDVLTERVRYYLSGTTLYRGTVEPSGDPLSYDTGSEVVAQLATYVNNTSTSMFTYYNDQYPFDDVNNPLPAPARLIETKLLHVFLRINIDPTQAPNDFDVESDVQLRNLKSNL